MTYLYETEKTKITLSEEYYRRFFTDCFTFEIKPSRLLTAIVLAYCRDSERYDTPCSTPLIFQSVLDALSSATEPTRHHNQTAPKQLQLSVSAEIREALRKDRRSHSCTGLLFRDLTEAYLELPFHQREQIAFHRQLEELMQKMGKTPFRLTFPSGRCLIVHPYKLVTDTDSLFNYVVGHAVPADQYDPAVFRPTPDTISCIRLRNICASDVRFQHEPGLCRIDRDAIERKLKTRSVSFFADEPIDITVDLNRFGEQMFRSIVHNRPYFVSRADNCDRQGFRRYIVKGTVFQTSIYFCSFEGNARIVSPPQAVDAVINRLKLALACYTQDE